MSPTSCCAMAARLQNAVVTASEVKLLLTISLTRVVASVSVMSSSAGESIPHLAGTSITSTTSLAMLPPMFHSLGMRASRAALFSAAICSQCSETVILSQYVVSEWIESRWAELRWAWFSFGLGDIAHLIHTTHPPPVSLKPVFCRLPHLSAQAGQAVIRHTPPSTTRQPG